MKLRLSCALVALLFLGAPCAPSGIVKCEVDGPTSLAAGETGTYTLACTFEELFQGKTYAQWFQVPEGSRPQLYLAKVKLVPNLEVVECSTSVGTTPCFVESRFVLEDPTDANSPLVRRVSAVRWSTAFPDVGGAIFGRRYEIGSVTFKKLDDNLAVTGFAGLFFRGDSSRDYPREIIDGLNPETGLAETYVQVTAGQPLVPKPPIQLDRALVIQ